jgi:hypothetical protein
MKNKCEINKRMKERMKDTLKSESRIIEWRRENEVKCITYEKEYDQIEWEKRK